MRSELVHISIVRDLMFLIYDYVYYLLSAVYRGSLGVYNTSMVCVNQMRREKNQVNLLNVIFMVIVNN
jgi:hypothetical protein